VRRLAERADAQAEQQAGDDRRREPDGQREQPVRDRVPVMPLDAERDSHDHAVFGPDDHGADDEDLRVDQDPRRGDQAGADEQRIEAGRVDGPEPDPGLHHIPGWRLVPLDEAAPAGVPGRGDHSVDRVHRDRRVPVKAEFAQPPQHRVGCRWENVELDRVAGGLPSVPDDHDVGHAVRGRHGTDERVGGVVRASDAYVHGHSGLLSMSLVGGPDRRPDMLFPGAGPVYRRG
jgi:hypothetical protein